MDQDHTSDNFNDNNNNLPRNTIEDKQALKQVRFCQGLNQTGSPMVSLIFNWGDGVANSSMMVKPLNDKENLKKREIKTADKSIQCFYCYPVTNHKTPLALRVHISCYHNDDHKRLKRMKKVLDCQCHFCHAEFSRPGNRNKHMSNCRKRTEIIEFFV